MMDVRDDIEATHESALRTTHRLVLARSIVSKCYRRGPPDYFLTTTNICQARRLKCRKSTGLCAVCPADSWLIVGTTSVNRISAPCAKRIY
jgi:hypothetical protein